MPSDAKPITRPELPALTSLRFFAALWVVLFHVRAFGLWRGGTAPYIATVELGYLGVSFFFVLSGFILVYVYAGREIPKARFWRARFARIYPAYAFSLLVSAPLLKYAVPVMHRLHASPALVFLSFPLLLEAWFPSTLRFWNVVAWSLSVEVFFYFVFPFAMRPLQRTDARRLRLWITGCWLLSLVFTLGYVLLRPDHVAWPNSQDFFPWLAVVKYNPVIRLPEFLLGMGVGLAFLRSQPQQTSRSWPILAGLALITLAVVSQRLIPYPVMHSGLLAPAFALIIYGFATKPAWTRFLSMKPLLLLGEASYSLYLLHAFPLDLITSTFHTDRSPHIGLVLAAYFAGVLLLAIGVFLCIENPLRRLLRSHRRIKPLTALVA